MTPYLNKYNYWAINSCWPSDAYASAKLGGHTCYGLPHSPGYHRLKKYCQNGDVTKCHQNFPRYWPFVQGIQQSPVNSPHKVQWREALMLFFIFAWINRWVNNRGLVIWVAIALIMTSLQWMNLFQLIKIQTTKTYSQENTFGYTVCKMRPIHYAYAYVCRQDRLIKQMPHGYASMLLLESSANAMRVLSEFGHEPALVNKSKIWTLPQSIQRNCGFFLNW